MNPIELATSRVRCLSTMRVLQSYLDGALDDLGARRVARHLEVCRRCGLEAEVYEEIKNSLQRRDVLDDATRERFRRFGERLAQDGESAEGERGR